MNKVLVVDDEEAILKGIRLNLGRTFDITLANGPHEALTSFKENGPFEVVVSDMRMPGMDGATMLRKLKEENPDVMMILLTGHADFEFGGSQALQSGMLFKILNKPFYKDLPVAEDNLTNLEFLCMDKTYITRVNHLTKLRLNDRTFSSWEQLRSLKKEKLKLKEIVSNFTK